MVDGSSQRQVFRIQYPETERARLQTPFGEFEIQNCSEAGLCYRLTGGDRPEVSRTIAGRILFNCGEAADVSGFVLRTQADRVALRFSKTVSPRCIMNEQRWLRDHARQQARAAEQQQPG
jgi:hypothetical protein